MRKGVGRGFVQCIRGLSTSVSHPSPSTAPPPREADILPDTGDTQGSGSGWDTDPGARPNAGSAATALLTGIFSSPPGFAQTTLLATRRWHGSTCRKTNGDLREAPRPCVLGGRGECHRNTGGPGVNGHITQYTTGSLLSHHGEQRTQPVAWWSLPVSLDLEPGDRGGTCS